MKKMRVFYLVVVLAASTLLLPAVNARAEVLSVPEIIDVLVSGFSYGCYTGPQINKYGWKYSGQCRCGWEELSFSREGSDLVRVLKANLYYRPEPTRESYQTLRVTGPVLKYTTTINVCSDGYWDDRGTINCDSVMLNEVVVVSKRLIKVNQTVLKGGAGAGVADGDRFSCNFDRR